MKTQYKILATTITAALFSGAASAATYAIEARSDAMGSVGTVSASYLTAPFFNPPPHQVSQVNNLLIIGLAAGTISNQYTQIYGDIPITGIEIDSFSSLIKFQLAFPVNF